MLIPRILHFIWIGTAPLPHAALQNISKWRELHPGWDVKLWRNDEVAALGKLENQAAFDSLPSWAAKSDILRLEILARFGGVYVDCADFEPLKNIEPLIKDAECFVGWEVDGKMMNNAIIGATPKHGAVLAAMDNLPAHLLTADNRDAAYATGPFFLNECWWHDARVTKFARKFLYPYDWHEPWRAKESFPEAFAVHHWHASWIDETVKPAKLLGGGDAPAVAVCFMGRTDPVRARITLRALQSQSIRPESIAVHHVDSLPTGIAPRLFPDATLWRDEDLMASVLRVIRWCNANDVRRLIFVPADHAIDRDAVEQHHMLGSHKIGVTFHGLFSSTKLFTNLHPKVFPFAVLAAHRRFVNMPGAPLSGTVRDIEEVFSIDAHTALAALAEAEVDSKPVNIAGDFATAWGTVVHKIGEALRIVAGCRFVPNWQSFSTKLCVHPVMEEAPCIPHCPPPDVVCYNGGYPKQH